MTGLNTAINIVGFSSGSFVNRTPIPSRRRNSRVKVRKPEFG